MLPQARCRPSEQDFLAEVPRVGALLPCAAAQSEINRHVFWLWGAFEALRQRVADALVDGRILAPELGGRIEAADLVELGEHQCYARLSHRGERLPSFHLRVDAPPAGAPTLAQALAATSAARFGRPFHVVAADRAALLDRIDAHVPAMGDGRSNTDPENGRIPPVSAGTIGYSRRSGARERNEHRNVKHQHADLDRSQLPLGLEPASAFEPLAEPDGTEAANAAP